MPARYPGTPEETAALDAYIKLMRAAESVTTRVGDVMASAAGSCGRSDDERIGASRSSR
jgi:hypothetical protein